MRDNLYSIIAKHTGKDVDKIRKDADRDYYMTPEEALEYGIIDKILMPNKDSEQTEEEK